MAGGYGAAAGDQRRSRQPSGQSGPGALGTGRTLASAAATAARRGSARGHGQAPGLDRGASTGERSRRGSSDEAPTCTAGRVRAIQQQVEPSRVEVDRRLAVTPHIYVPVAVLPVGSRRLGSAATTGGTTTPGIERPRPQRPTTAAWPGPATTAMWRVRPEGKPEPRDAAAHGDGHHTGRATTLHGMFERACTSSRGRRGSRIRADGDETLEFEIRLLPDRTLTDEAGSGDGPSRRPSTGVHREHTGSGGDDQDAGRRGLQLPPHLGWTKSVHGRIADDGQAASVKPPAPA